ncbi:hypothetical protein F2Q69_00058289 [Brassica cretica]|uniref:Uncharacterized protein n=1 Tax=Brassica cretica TaxID=69181 RepID=A0A8S9RN06_BRACR|nr:hypothetical protein F2Q69_00058289 [Brassica cretica]
MLFDCIVSRPALLEPSLLIKFLSLRGDLSSDGDAIAFLHLIDDGLSPPRAQVVPHLEEVRPPSVKACKAAKRKKHGNEAAYDQLESMLVVKENISKHRLFDRCFDIGSCLKLSRSQVLVWRRTLTQLDCLFVSRVVLA